MVGSGCGWLGVVVAQNFPSSLHGKQLGATGGVRQLGAF